MPRRASQESKGPGDGAGGILDELNPFGQVVVPDDRDAADHVAVPVEILGRRVIYDISARLERSLEKWRGKGVVDDQQGPGAMRNVSDRAMSVESHERIARRLDEHGDGPIGDRVGHALWVAGVHERESEAEVLENPVEEPKCTAVDIFGADDVVARCGTSS